MAPIPRGVSHANLSGDAVLYHQPEKMGRSKEDLDARKENLAQLKKQHGID